MAKKKSDNFQTFIPQGKIFTTPIEEVMPQSMLPYAEFVILDRALPRVEDGLKPVQRRILYTMAEMGLTPDKPHKKSARIVGDCMGKYHPHGDSSVYDAMVRMAQDFNMRLTLVNGHGNFGSVDGDPAAAMRYTEARLESLALELLKDIDKETVPFSFNFDDSLLEPDILPGRFPNLLVNGANGIAVGLATNIPTHNLGEVIDGVCAYIDNPRISLNEMMKIIPGPDFSTGGFIIENELKQAYETGRGRITLRAKYSVENGDNGKKEIIFTELPYQTNKADLLRKIMLLKEAKKETLSGIADIVDESDRTGMRAVIYCKKDADVDAILNFLFKYTDLECTFGINMVAIAGGKPQQLGLLDVIKYYVAYQRQVIIRRTKYELKEAEARCHILEGLIIGVHNIDEVIRIIKSSESTPVARTRLMEAFALSERQAQAILDLRLARLAKLEITKLENELKELKKRIERLQAILASRDEQMNIVKSEMREIKNKYPCPRKTQIVRNVEDIKVFRQDVKRASTDWVLAITAADNIKFIDKIEFDSKFKKPLPATYRGDSLYKQTITQKSDGGMLIFTNYGNCVRVDLNQFDATGMASSGIKLKEFYDAALRGEKAVKIFAVGETMPKGELLFFTRQGTVKRTPWEEYAVSRPVFPAIKLKTGDEVLNVEQFIDEPDNTMCFVTRAGICLNADKDDVPSQGRVTGGVRGILLNDGDEVVFATQFYGEGEIIIVSNSGAAKRVIASLFQPMGRGRKGMMIVDGKSEVAFADYVTVPYKLAVVRSDNSVTEMDTEDLTIEPRPSKGKPLPSASEVTGVIALKYRSEYDDGNQQLTL
ncbi:MAG: DNA topoisomerase 4 subunit A [Clostridia bacterium]|nr:DNA topoisomerase 4 subunit A [Clostridia bacterium]